MPSGIKIGRGLYNNMGGMVDQRPITTVQEYCDMTDNEFNKQVGEYMAYVRSGRKLSQADMAQNGWISKNYLSSVERGLNGISLRAFIKFCCAVDMTPDVVLGLKRYEGPEESERDIYLESVVGDNKKTEQKSIDMPKNYSESDLEEILSSIAMLLTMESTERRYANKMLVALNTEEDRDDRMLSRVLPYVTRIAESAAKSSNQDTKKRFDGSRSAAKILEAAQSRAEESTFKSKPIKGDLVYATTMKVEIRNNRPVLVDVKTGEVVHEYSDEEAVKLHLVPGMEIKTQETVENNA